MLQSEKNVFLHAVVSQNWCLLEGDDQICRQNMIQFFLFYVFFYLFGDFELNGSRNSYACAAPNKEKTPTERYREVKAWLYLCMHL